MAPLRVRLSHLIEAEQTARKVSYWYGARSRQEVFYSDCFQGLAKQHANLALHLALSSPLPEDDWTSHRGIIRTVVLEEYLHDYPSPQAVEYYLCGLPMMIGACKKCSPDSRCRKPASYATNSDRVELCDLTRTSGARLDNPALLDIIAA